LVSSNRSLFSTVLIHIYQVRPTYSSCSPSLLVRFLGLGCPRLPKFATPLLASQSSVIEVATARLRNHLVYVSPISYNGLRVLRRCYRREECSFSACANKLLCAVFGSKSNVNLLLRPRVLRLCTGDCLWVSRC
jgi:hypothetical protein